MFKMKQNITNSVTVVALSLLLLSFFVQTINIVDVDAAKTSREKACINPRNTQEKDPKFCAHLIVIKNVDGGTASPSDFTISVTSTSSDKPSPSTFKGSSSGTSVTLGQGSYQVTETNIPNDYTPSYSSGCSGTISAGQTKTCTITNTFTPPTGTLTVVKNVKGGTASPSDFIITVVGNNPSPKTFPGSSSGTTVTIGEGEYFVGEASIAGYDPGYSSGCSGTISADQTKECTVTNYKRATLTIIKQVVGGTAQPSDFEFLYTIFSNDGGQCHGVPQQQSPFSEQGTTVEVPTDPSICGYDVIEFRPSGPAGYTPVYSPECSSNTAPSPGQSLTCIVTNTFTGT
jgi:hypothetical protein